MVDQSELSSKKLLKLTARGAEKVIQSIQTWGWEAISEHHPQLVPAMTKLFLTRLATNGIAQFIRALTHLYTFNLYYELVGDKDFRASVPYYLLHSCGISRNALHIHKTVV